MVKIRISKLYPSRAISKHGRVFSNCTGRWVELKSYVANTGYLMVHAGQGKMVTVHSLVAEVWIGPRPDGMQVNHKDGVKLHNTWTNLEYTTPKENSTHARVVLKVGATVHQTGEHNRNCKLSDADVLSIRQLYKPGHRPYQSELATRFGVSSAHICDIVNNKYRVIG